LSKKTKLSPPFKAGNDRRIESIGKFEFAIF